MALRRITLPTSCTYVLRFDGDNRCNTEPIVHSVSQTITRSNTCEQSIKAIERHIRDTHSVTTRTASASFAGKFLNVNVGYNDTQDRTNNHFGEVTQSLVTNEQSSSSRTVSLTITVGAGAYIRLYEAYLSAPGMDGPVFLGWTQQDGRGPRLDQVDLPARLSSVIYELRRRRFVGNSCDFFPHPYYPPRWFQVYHDDVFQFDVMEDQSTAEYIQLKKVEPQEDPCIVRLYLGGRAQMQLGNRSGFYHTEGGHWQDDPRADCWSMYRRFEKDGPHTGAPFCRVGDGEDFTEGDAKFCQVDCGTCANPYVLLHKLDQTVIKLTPDAVFHKTDVRRPYQRIYTGRLIA